jgi:ubiquinone/menaquinone biosynthesis C-methylase UbiE
MGLSSWRFAATYDRFSAKAERLGLSEHRSSLLAGAGGRVLEVGGGTGANLQHYGPAVKTLTVTEPDPHMLKRLQRKVVGYRTPVTVLRAPAEDLPFDDGSFDLVVSTLVLCSTDDQPRALRELHRVLRPGGQLLFMEHVRSDDPALAKKQDRMNWLNRVVVLCDCNRPTLERIEAEGFTVTRLERSILPGAPSFASPLVFGAANSPARQGEQMASDASRSA